MAITGTIFLEIGRKRYQVASFDQASAMFCAARDKIARLDISFTASKMPHAMLVNEDGRNIGYVSYNGRVWEGLPRDWTGGTKLLFDNWVSA